MDDALLHERLHASEERNAVLCRELASLRAAMERMTAEFGALRRDYEALADATRIITDERDAQGRRIAELEAANNRLVDMLWGRRSERRTESPDQLPLNLPDGPSEPASAAQEAIVEAQAVADEASEREALRRLAARRKARQEK